MEAPVYICGWKREAQGFRLWIRTNPRVKGMGATLNAARAALWRATIRAYGDGEPVFEFCPPLPDGGQDGPEPQWVKLWAVVSESGYVGDARTPPFSQGYCCHCGLPSGSRTTEPLKIEAVPRNCEAFEVSIANHIQGAMCCGTSRQVFSSDFLDTLTPVERASAFWQEIQPYRRSRRQFFELVAPAPVAFVAKKGVSTWTWECTACGGRPGLLQSPGYLELPRFISAATVPAGATVFTIGWHDEPLLCISAARWSELAGSSSSKGIASSPVVALDPALVSDSLSAYPIPLYEKLSRIQERLWNQYRDELLASPEVLTMKADPKLSDDDVWDYIHSRVDDRLALPVVYRDHISELRS